MLKHTIAAFCLIATTYTATAQTLFTYGGQPVSTTQFLQAYQKNNAGPKNAKSLQEYLDLYIASRLKIQEAKDLKLDTLPQMVADLDNLRNQIITPYLTDQDAVNKLVAEAFTRSQKDIHLAHIFIATKDLTADEAAAADKKLESVNEALKKGVPFAKVAQEFSDDPAAKTNGGDLGWITVFSLPYELEKLAYSTPVGKTSAVYHSKAGYHIFKNIAERKALGRMKAQQILLAFPPGADEAQKQQIKKLADSIYSRLLKGDDFATLATQYSNDVISAAAGGSIPEFGVGQYDPLFENIVFNNLKNGQLSKPFLTSYGYHIVKRIAQVPVLSSKVNEKGMEALRSKVESDDRINSTKEALAKKILNSVPFAKEAFSTNELWAYSDSVLDYKTSGRPLNIKSTSTLFKIGNETITANNWIMYAQTFRYKSDGSGIKPYTQLWDEFVNATALDYYRAHLEDFNDAFKRQLAEFSEGNLFFEIMQRKVWTPAQTDSASLQDYYNSHRSKYVWSKSADAILFYASDANAAKDLYAKLRTNPATWKTMVAGTDDKVAADSGRFEVAQIPNGNKVPIAKGLVTAPVVNPGDQTTSFAYILSMHNSPEPRSFAEAKSMVVNDYQSDLDKEWIAQLKKKYPVVVNEKAVAGLMGKK